MRFWLINNANEVIIVTEHDELFTRQMVLKFLHKRVLMLQAELKNPPAWLNGRYVATIQIFPDFIPFSTWPRLLIVTMCRITLNDNSSTIMSLMYILIQVLDHTTDSNALDIDVSIIFYT